MKGNLVVALLALGSLTLSACGQKNAPAGASLLPPPGGAPALGADYDADGNYVGPGSQADLRRVAGSDRVLFDLDSYGLDDSDKEILRRQAGWLAQYPNTSATIEGHCDERGTREYNLALGERRANAAKNYLAALGVSPGRLSVVSFGKERPEAVGSDERSYAINRRAVTVVIR